MIDVMIITFNEELNLPYCLGALKGWAHKVFVIDSGSTDQTQQLAESYGIVFVHHNWEGYARQKNWGLQNLAFESEWILILDADEVITSALQHQLEKIASKSPDQVLENGFFLNRLTYFNGQPIRHCGFFPNWNMRFFKRGLGLYEDREVHEHVVIDNPVGYVREPMIHHDRRGLEHYFAKHNRYSTLEARSIFDELGKKPKANRQANLTHSARFRRWLKRHIMPRAPFAGFWRFLFMYFLQLGILDGSAGLAMCKFISLYDSLVAMKLRELRRITRGATAREIAHNPSIRGLAIVEGGESLVLRRPRGQKPLASTSGNLPTQMQPESSPWTFREKVGRAIWMLVGGPLFRLTFHNWHGFRAMLLRIFGAKVGKGVAIRPTVNVEVPWMLQIEDDVTIGDHAILYSLGPISIGKRSIISQYSHLCAGTHDYSDRTFKLLRAPINIGDDVWIGADAFVGPGVHIGALSVLGARSSTYKNLDERQVFVGNPARAIKERILK